MTKLIAQIRVPRLEGTVMKVAGEGSGGPLQAKTVYPSHSEQIIAPDEDYYGLVSVTVKGVPRLPFAAVSVKEGIGAAECETVIPAKVRAALAGEDLTFSYSVAKASGASYGFNGTPTVGFVSENIVSGGNIYYYSANYNDGDSYAMCRVDFYSSEERTITLNCISYGESNYDYGIVSTVNTTLSLSTTDDGATGSDLVTKNFKGLSSPDVIPVSITIPAGDSFITIKYRKDSSGNSGDDRFKFAVVM